MEAAAAGAEAAGAGLASVAAVAAPVAVAFVAVGASIALTKAAIEKFTQRAHELSGFSADLMQAEVNKSVQSLYDDIKEANTLGPDLARMLDAETSISHEWRQIILPFKKVIVEQLANFLEAVAEWLQSGRAILTKEFWAEFIQDVVAALKPGIMGGITVKDAWEKINAKMEDIKRKMKEEDKDSKIDFLAELYDYGMIAETAQAFPDQMFHRPNIPIVQFFGG